MNSQIQKISFSFFPENIDLAKKVIAKYPVGKKASAVLPLLELAQRQNNNWLSAPAIEYVAELLNMPSIRVHEVATFYTMFNLEPVGKNVIQICRTTPCWLKGSEAITKICREKLGIGIGETTKDGLFTLKETECLGACVNAPVAQINDDYFEGLLPEDIAQLIEDLSEGRKPRNTPRKAHVCSCGKKKE